MTKGWFKIENDLVDSGALARLSGPAVKVCVVFRRMAHNSRRNPWPSLSYLAKLTGESRSNVQRAIRELIDKGFIARVTKGKGRGCSSVYEVLKCPTHGTDKPVTVPPVEQNCSASGTETVPPATKNCSARGTKQELKNNNHQQQQQLVAGATAGADEMSERQEQTREALYECKIYDPRATAIVREIPTLSVEAVERIKRDNPRAGPGALIDAIEANGARIADELKKACTLNKKVDPVQSRLDDLTRRKRAALTSFVSPLTDSEIWTRLGQLNGKCRIRPHELRRLDEPALPIVESWWRERHPDEANQLDRERDALTTRIEIPSNSTSQQHKGAA